MQYTLTAITGLITAVGALGTAAFGLVDSFKALPGGGISRAGFKFIRQAIRQLAPEVPLLAGTGLSQSSLLYTLTSQWINGAAALTDQVNIAKSLIKLRLIPATAAALANATGVDAGVLGQVATSIQTGTALTPQQTDVYGRFDLLLTTMLNQAYQRGAQRYRNVAKFAAIPVSVALAVAAAFVIPNQIPDHKVLQAVLLGLIATPVAPIAKDISSGINTAVQAIQARKN